MPEIDDAPAQKLPWMKWFPADFRAESTLKLCSRSARSVWIDMLGLMHEATPYGHLVVNGIAPSIAQLARLLGERERDAAKWLQELETAGVFSRNDDGVIYCRRMVAENRRRETNRTNGSLGGNPKLKPTPPKPDNPPDNPEVKARASRDLEAQKLEKKEDTPPSVPPLPEPAPPKPATARRGSRLAETTLPDDWLAFAEAAGHHDPPGEWERFADYWRGVPGQKGTKLDWPATWRNWVRKSLDDNRSRPTLLSHVAQPRPSTDAWFRAAGKMGGRIPH